VWSRSRAHRVFTMTVYLVNPSHVSFGIGVITPRWLYVLAAATPPSFGVPTLVDETLESFDTSAIAAGDIVGIGIHTGNALRGYEIGVAARAAGAYVVYGGIHASLYPDEARTLGRAHAVVTGDGEGAWPEVLRDCRAGSPRAQYDGGRIEADDTDAIAAALRESFEEIGLAPAHVAPIGFLDPLCTITGFRVLPLVGVVDPGFVPRPDPSEVAEVFEVPLDYLLEPRNLLRKDVAAVLGRPMPDGRPREVLEFVDRGNPRQRIWGATASILFNLRERIATANDRELIR